MFVIAPNGQVQSPRVRPALCPTLERGPLPLVHGIVVHQTDSPTAAATLAAWRQPGAYGAHFLVDKDGTVWQTASVLRRTDHVGYIKSRCIAEHNCTPAEFAQLRGRRPGHDTGTIELRKPFPRRYPMNADAIGIENVSRALRRAAGGLAFEPLSAAQVESTRWLVDELAQTLGVPLTEVYRHPEVSWKLESEGASAQW